MGASTDGLYYSLDGPVISYRSADESVVDAEPVGAAELASSAEQQTQAALLASLEQPPLTTLQAAPLSGAASGGDVVLISGRNFGGSLQAPACGFGTIGPVASQFAGSNSVAACVSPAHVPGSVGLEAMSLSAQAAPSVGGPQFAYLDATSSLPLAQAADDYGQSFAPTSSAVQPSVVDSVTVLGAVITGADPASGPESGGTLVAVDVDNLHPVPPDLACRFGSVGPVRSQAGGGSVLLCSSPARLAGGVPVGLASAGASLFSSSVSFFYAAADGLDGPLLPSEDGSGLQLADSSSAAAPTLSGIQPPGGGAEGGAVVELLSGNLQATSYSACSFGAVQPVVGRAAANGLQCISPAHAAEAVAVAVSANGLVYSFSTSGIVLFTYTAGSENSGAVAAAPQIAAPAAFRSAWPSVVGSGGGTVVAVAGSELQSSLAPCLFGGRAGPGGLLASSALIMCEAPASPDGLAAVGDAAEAAWVLFAPALTPVAVSPASSPAEGGVLIAVGADREPTSPYASCRFGAVGPVAGQAAGAALACVSPAHAPGGAIVNVALNGADYASPGLSEGSFTYVPSAPLKLAALASAQAAPPRLAGMAPLSGFASSILTLAAGPAQQFSASDVFCLFGLEVSLCLIVQQELVNCIV